MKRPIVPTIVLATAVSLISVFVSAQADIEIDSAARQYLSAQVRPWLNAPIIVDAVNKQDMVHANLSQADIDQLDQTWRVQAGSGGGSMIDIVLSTALSSHLKSMQNDANGLITEIIVMDDKGLNVGQSNVTSDFWQGDESKWQESYLVTIGIDAESLLML